MSMFKSLVAAWVALVMAFVSFVPGFVVPEDKSGETDKSYPYIFVHGFLGWGEDEGINQDLSYCCLLYTSQSPRDSQKSRMPSSA